MGKNYKSILLGIVFFSIAFNLIGCSKINGFKNKENNEQINFLVDVEDKDSKEIFNFILEEFKIKNPNIKVSVNTMLSQNLEKELSKKNVPDIVLTSRGKILNLANKGLVDDLTTLYNKSGLDKNSYSSVKSYGIVGEKYFGVALVPYVLEFLYNEENLKSLNLKTPKNSMELKEVIKQLNSKSIKIPLVINDGVDINNLIFSMVSNNKVCNGELQNIYLKDKTELQNISSIQDVFDHINKLNKDGVLNKDCFQIGNDLDIQKLNQGKIPMVITTSYFNNKFDEDKVTSINLCNDKKFINNVILVDAIITLPLKGANRELSRKFIEFVASKEVQQKLFKKGFITFDKNINNNKNLGDINKNSITTLQNSNENSIPLVLNLKDEFKIHISSKVEQILQGKYTGREWREITN